MSTRATRGKSEATGNSPTGGAVSGASVLAEPPSNPEATAEVPVATRTKSGRVSKPPVRYEPVEQVEDDYAAEDYDSDETGDVSSEISSEDEETDDEETDADEDGNLDGFVVPDKSETSESDSDGESAVPDKKRRAVAVQKRVTPASTSARK